MQTTYFVKLLFILTVTLFALTKASGQMPVQNGKQVQQLLKKAAHFYAADNYHKALETYLHVLEIDPENANALYQAAINNLLIYSDEESLNRFLKYEQMQPPADLDKHYYYWLGRAYHAHAQFEEAEKAYRKYLEILPQNDTRQEEVQQLVAQTQSGKKFAENPVDFYAISLGRPLNSRYSDHSPMLTNNRQTLIFTSRRTENKNGEEITPEGDAFENIYTTDFVDGRWQKPEPLGNGLNNKKQHTSNVQLFDNETKMLIYKSVNFGSLFITEKKDGKWSRPRKFSKYTSTGKFIPNGFVTKDGKAVYFASSQGSRNGTLDLFVSYLTADSSWSEPERLPGTVNSAFDEDAPFVSEDGLTLYFSSRGHDSMGGYDVFKATFDPVSRQWTKAVNMGYPINSPSDDIYFIPDHSDKAYFVASAREGTVGQEDIFVVRLFGELLVKGTVTDTQSGKALAGYSVNFTAVKNPERKAASVTDSSGNYTLRVRSNYLYHVAISDTAGNPLLLDTLKLPLAYNDVSVFEQNFSIKFPAAPVVHKQGMQVNNLNLVKLHYQPSDSLVITGTVQDAARVVSGVQIQLRKEDTNEVMYTTTSDSAGKYMIALIPESVTDYVIDMSKPGYLLNSIVILPADKPAFEADEDTVLINENLLQLTTQLQSFEVGARQVIGGIYFDFNHYVLSPESAFTLDKWYQLLQENPGMHLQISGHTDNINTPAINKLISQRRAKAVADYLVTKGIRSSRLAVTGYGGTQPVTSNEKAINGQDVNRRVEISIVSK